MKVAILDKHTLFAESLQQLFINQLGLDNSQIYSSAECLIEHAYDKVFDMVIIDRSLLGKDESALINYLRSSYPAEMAIVVLEEANNARPLGLSKVNAVIQKNSPVNEFIEIVAGIKNEKALQVC